MANRWSPYPAKHGIGRPGRRETSRQTIFRHAGKRTFGGRPTEGLPPLLRLFFFYLLDRLPDGRDESRRVGQVGFPQLEFGDQHPVLVHHNETIPLFHSTLLRLPRAWIQASKVSQIYGVR